MVFESFVANILNGVLGDFVDNLDPSQLNIGIWGGDVKLHKLEIKESAFDSWGFPIKVKFGYLNALIMKIPWNKLFTRPVIVDIEGLHIIVVPNRGVVYDEEKARKSERETKQKELNALEENRNAKRKDKEDINDTFVEKLLAQVIKNLQINIKSIHVRYEDKYSNRHRPFAAGITLENLEFQTTEANFQAKIHKEETKIFYKLVSLNNLAIYWNSDSKLISDMESKKNILSALNAKIATKRSQPRDYKYAFGPITMTTKLSLNQKPEVDKFKVPKIDLSVETDELSLCIRQPQYQDLLHFLEAQKRFNLAQRYLKYRPYLTEYRGHYKEWYQFAYNCIVSDIRRRRTNWSWAEMKKHRQMVRAYREAWLHFRTEKHPSAVHKRTIEEAEEKLDTFNLNIARQQADMDIDRLGFVRTEDQAVQTWSSWVKSWFGRTAPVTPAHMPKGQAFVAQLQESITPEEKAKLFAAIDYQGNILPTKYPKEFVENKVSVKVLSVTIAVDSAIQLSFSELTMDLAQRSSARAIHLKCSVKTISITGLGHSILTMLIPEEYWLNAEFITNPLDGSFDQFVGLTTAPLLLKYHARAANAFLDVFRTPRSVRPNQLATAAFARYEAAKFGSITALQFAVEKNVRLKLEIHFASTTIAISKGGDFREDTLNLIAQLGSLGIRTIEEIANFNFSQDVKSQKHKSVLFKAYMKIQILMSDIQLCFADNYHKCIHAHKDVNSPYHIVKPMRMELNFCKAMIEDFHIPRFRLYCKLPAVSVSISDERLTDLLELLLSFPTPTVVDESEASKAPALSTSEICRRAKMLAMLRNGIDAMNSPIMSETENVQLRDLQKAPDPKTFIYEFKIDEISVLLLSKKFQRSKCGSPNSIPPFAAFNVQRIGVRGHMTEGGYFRCKLSLQFITMDDKREGTTIQRLLDKKTSEANIADSFVYLLYEHNSRGDKNVELSSSSFYLLLNPEFFGALASFVVMPEIMEESESDLHAKLSTNRSKEVLESANKFFLGGATNKKANGDVRSLAIKCRIRQVEVILIEDSYKPDDSQALILSFNIFLDTRNENNIHHINGSVKDLQITNTYFNVDKREEFSYSVLRKVDIVLMGTIDEMDKAQGFHISMDQVHVTVSPDVIRLLSAVSTQFSQHQIQSKLMKRSIPNVFGYRQRSPPERYIPSTSWLSMLRGTPNDNSSTLKSIVADSATAAAAAATRARTAFVSTRAHRKRSFAFYASALILIALIFFILGFSVCYYFT